MKTILITILVYVLMLCNGNSQDHSNIKVEITDTSEIKFLDTVEAKLLSKVKAVTQKDFKGEGLTLFQINPFGSDWTQLLSHGEIEAMSLYGFLPDEYLTTNKYELSIKWDSIMSEADIIGFTRMYYYYLRIQNYGSPEVKLGPFAMTLVCLPLSEYHKFLTDDENKKLHTIIRKEFIRQVDDKDSPYNDSISYRTIEFNKCDSLPQFNLRYWTYYLQYLLEGYEIMGYSDTGCKIRMSGRKIQDDIFSHLDTIITFGDSSKMPMTESCPRASITVAEKWSFDTINPTRNNCYADIKVFREISAISLNTIYYYYKDGYGRYIKNKPVWMNYSDIIRLKELNMGKMKLYKEIIDADLYRRLEVNFPNFIMNNSKLTVGY